MSFTILNIDNVIHILSYIKDDKIKIYLMFKNKEIYKRKKELYLHNCYNYSNFLKSKINIKEYSLLKIMFDATIINKKERGLELNI